MSNWQLASQEQDFRQLAMCNVQLAIGFAGGKLISQHRFLPWAEAGRSAVHLSARSVSLLNEVI
jgi:hypothetical protein